MRVFVVTNSELGWDNIVSVYEADSEEDVIEHLKTEGYSEEDLIIHNKSVENIKNES